MKPPKKIWVEVEDGKVGLAYGPEEDVPTKARLTIYTLAPKAKREPLYWVLKCGAAYRHPKEVGFIWQETRKGALVFPTREQAIKYMAYNFYTDGSNIKPVPVYRKEKKS